MHDTLLGTLRMTKSVSSVETAQDAVLHLGCAVHTTQNIIREKKTRAYHSHDETYEVRKIHESQETAIDG